MNPPSYMQKQRMKYIARVLDIPTPSLCTQDEASSWLREFSPKAEAVEISQPRRRSWWDRSEDDRQAVRNTWL